MANFCKNCGTDLKGNNICQNCGTVNKKGAKETTKKVENKEVVEDKKTENTNQKTNTTNYTQTQTNSMALLGFIFSLVSIACCGFLSIFGLIFSIIGLAQAPNYNDNNKGLAIAGIVISSITIAFSLLAIVINVAVGVYNWNYWR